MEETPVKDKILCYHCGDECPGTDITADSRYFCCTGCRTVYQILNENSLCSYYEIDKAPGLQPSLNTNKFDFLDDEKTAGKLLLYKDETASYVKFHIPQIHCSSCIWILEKLYRLNEAIFHSEVNFHEKAIFIKYRTDKASLKDVVKTLASIGYEPLLLMDSVEGKKEKQGDKKILYKLGIAGFCFGNIMLLSFPEYLSINVTEIFYRKLFSYLNFILSLPVLFYSASDYFTSAYLSLKKKIININLPLSIGIAVLFARSCFEIFTSSGAGYFDSMTGLVFLLLTGKYVQQRAYTSLNFERDYKSFFPLSVLRKNGKGEISIPVSELKAGDRIIVRNKEIIPADSVLFSGRAYIDYSFITGESEFIEAAEGTKIYAGGRHHGSSIELEVIKETSQSYLTSLWNNPSFSPKKEKHFTDFTNLVSRYFTGAIILTAFIAGLLWLPNTYKAMDVFTAVLIVACPCALALSVPFTYGNGMRISGRNKFYLKNSLSLEDLARNDVIVFDKTGTLTQSENSKIIFQGKDLSVEEKAMISAAAKNSIHPLSRKIADSINAAALPEIFGYDEKEGYGIEAGFGQGKLKMGSSEFAAPGLLPGVNSVNKTRIYVSLNNEYLGFFEVSNNYREGILEVIKKMSREKEIFMLSGDNEGEKVFLNDYFKDEKYMLFKQAPGDKLEFIKSLQGKGKRVLMIGDGLNDAGALSQSDFGISVSDNVSNFSPACDAIMDSSSLVKIYDFINFSKDSTKIIYLNFVISLLYNFAGLSFAVNGLLSPLIAAVLMPLSSLTVVVSAYFGTWYAGKMRGLNCR